MRRKRIALTLAVTVALALASKSAFAEKYAFGGSIRGHGGIASADSSLGSGVGMDEPDPLRGSDARAAGVRGGGGFGSELFVAVDDVRVGLDATILFSDGYRLSHAPLPNGFTASTPTATTYDFNVFIGRMFAVGVVRPYIDLRLGVGVLQTSIRLEHPALGFVGATQYDAVRFLFGPRTGVYVPLTSRFYIDTGVEVGLLGFSRVVGFAGFAAEIGSDDGLSHEQEVRQPREHAPHLPRR